MVVVLLGPLPENVIELLQNNRNTKRKWSIIVRNQNLALVHKHKRDRHWIITKLSQILLDRHQNVSSRISHRGCSKS
jgi:hypothetical protein